MLVEDIISERSGADILPANSIAIIDYNSPSMLEDFAQAQRDIGFAVIKNHPLDYGFISNLYDKWEHFFRYGDKKGFEFNSLDHDGYVCSDQAETAKGSTVKDLKEFYHFYSWARCPDNLKDDTDKLLKQLESIACHLLSGMQSLLPLEVQQQLDRPLSDMVKDCKRSLLRPIYYPPVTGNEEPGAVRAAQHEDICMVTLIPSATAPGLQVLSQSGAWVDVPCDPNYIIANTGDLLQECTNGFYPSTTHRVINPSKTSTKSASRFSMPLFLHAHDDVVLSEKYTADSYRIKRFKELGLMDEDE